MSSLSHHGIKGQRWGVRRFQNKDGTLTAAGRKRKQHLIEVGSGKRKRLIEAAKPFGSSGDYSKDVTGLNRRGIRGQVINEDDNTHVIKKSTSIYRTAANPELNDDGTYASLTKNDVDRYIDYGRSGELPGADKSNLNSMKIFEFSANRDLKIANGKYITEIITDDVKRKMKNGDSDQVKLGKEILESFKRYEEDLNVSFSTSEMRRSKEAYSRTEAEKEFDRELVGKASDRLALYDKTMLDYASGKDYRVIRDRLKREGYDGFIDVEDVTTITNLVRRGANTEYPVVILNANDVLTLKRSVKESETQRRLKRGTKFNMSRGELTNLVQHTSIGGTMYIEGNALILGDSSYLEHHGVLGQKWGVRRFQNKDGTRTALGKKQLKAKRLSKNEEGIRDVYRSLSDEDFRTLGYSKEEADQERKDDFLELGRRHTDYDQYNRVRYKDGKAVGYIAATGYQTTVGRGKKIVNILAVDLAVHSEYRGNGYSVALGKDLVRWFDTYGSKEYDRMEWYAMSENIGSQKAAERSGFTRRSSKEAAKGWVKYRYDKKQKLKHTSIGGTMYIEGNALILDDSSYLEHHGIKGQKWGIRRTPEQLGRINGGTAKVYKLHNYKGPLYFISEQDLDGETLHPRVPQNYLTQNGFEDNTTERVCFSYDPGKCLTAMSSNVSGKTFNVYSPADKHDVYKPNNITVPDADVTGELWIKEPVKLKKVGSIKCTGDTGEDGLKYTYGDQEAELYDWNYEWLDRSDQTSATKLKHTSIGGTMYIEGNALILGDSSYLEHHGIRGQRWGVRRFQNKDGTRTAAGKKRDAENLKSSQEAKNVNSKIHSHINKQLSSEDLDTGKSNYDFASDLIKDPDFEKVIMPVVQDIRQTKAKYGNKEPYEFTGDEHNAYMNDIDRLDKKTGELAIAIGLAEKGEPHKKSTPPEGEYERVDMFRYALARYLDEHSPDGYSDEGDWIYHSSMEGTFFIEDGTLYLSHHGIRGQRWGVRRFQNRDGSLTNAGRKRLGYATKGVTQTVGKAFKAGVKAGGNAVKAVKAHHEKKEAEKLEKKKEKASKTRLGVMANKDLFTNEEIRKLNERFKLEDEMKMATLQKGVEIAKAVGTIAQNVGTVAKTYEDVTGQSLSPIKRKAAEEKARQDKEDRERRIAREDADEARKAAKEERDIAIHEQTLRKAIASADTQEFTAQKTKAEADSSILDLYKKGQDFNGGSDATGQSWVEKAKSGGKNPFDDMIANRDPEYAQIRKEHDEKVARKERIAELERREKERQAEKEAASKQSAPQQKQGGGDNDALFSQKGSLPIDKDRYRNNRAMEKAKQVKEDAAEERAKKQDEKAAKATIDDMMEARRRFTDAARANSNGAFDRETAANYIKGKAKELPSKLNPINAISKKITDRALKEEEAASRKAMEDEYKKASRSQGRDEANYTMYYNRINALQSQGYSERQAKKVADTESPFSSKRNRRFEYNEKIGEIEATHRKNSKELNKANKELTDYYYKLINGPGYDPGTPKREALDRKYAQKRGELERLEKDNNEMLDREKKKAKQILEHSFSIQNGVLFVDSSDGLTHHGVKGQRWGVRRFQNADGSLTEKGRKHYEKAIAKLDRKQVNSDNRRGRLERQHPFAVTASAILTGSAYAALMVASAANPAMVVAGSAIAAAVSALGTHVDYSVAEAWEGRGTKRRQKKRKEYEKMLNHDGLIVSDGTLYLEHHGVLGMKWGKHLRAGKGPIAGEAGGGGGSGEDDEKLKEMAKKAGMSVAEYKQKFASKIGGAASKVGEKISVKNKHLVVNGNRSVGTRGLAVGETGEKPKSFKEKAYNALGGKYKTQASEAHREMVTARNNADDKARRANAQGRAANANKKAGNVREYMANKEGARQLDAEAKGARVSQWEATKKANRAQWKYDHSLAGIYDKATGKYKQAHKKTAIPKTIDRWKYEYKDGPNSKLFNNGKSKAKTAKEQAKAEVWNAADHQIKAKEYNDVSNSYGGNTNYYGQAYKNAAEREARLAEGSYRRAAALGKQTSSETSTSSRPRARKKKHTSGGSGVTVRQPGRKPVSRTKRVTQSSTGVKKRSRRVRHSDGSSELYTEGTRLVIYPKA